jgi:peptide deformylase
MSCLTILEYPDPRLRIKAKPVTDFDSTLSRQIDDLLDTLYATNGIGLAASQVNLHRQLLVIDISEGRNQPQVFVNPRIVSRQMTAMVEESCLSVPGVAGNVARAARIDLQYQDRHGAAHALNADGVLAVCLQHEMDHLDGTLFVDRLSLFKRLRIRVASRARLSG